MTRPPVSDETLAERLPRPVVWQIPTNVKIILTIWALALFMFVGIFSLWQYLDRREAGRQAAEERAAMCSLIDTIIGDTEPPAGPAGERARQVRRDLLAYRSALHCAA